MRGSWYKPWTWWGRNEVKTGTATSTVLLAPNQGTETATWDYGRWVQDGYQGNAVLYRAISLIARACAGINWIFYRGEDELEADHPAVQLFQRPNPLQTRAQFLEQVVTHLELVGEAFAGAVGPTEGPPREIYVLPPNYVSIRRPPQARMGEIAAFEYRQGSAQANFAPDRMLWWRSTNPNPLSALRGQPPAYAARKAIDTIDAIFDFNLAVLNNGGLPGLILAAKDSALEGTIDWERIREGLKARQGAQHAGWKLVLEGPVEAQKVGLTPQEMSYHDLFHTALRTIAICLGVPPEMLGDVAQKKYANYKEARASFYIDTVLPLMDNLISEVNHKLSLWYPGEDITVKYDADDIEALQEEQGAVYSRLSEAWWLTPDEKRAAVGYEPLPKNGDKLLLPVGLQTFEALLTGGLGTSSAAPRTTQE
jgi:HK97 family phage portal protein